jgi:hypothetical protein
VLRILVSHDAGCCFAVKRKSKMIVKKKTLPFYCNEQYSNEYLKSAALLSNNNMLEHSTSPSSNKSRVPTTVEMSCREELDIGQI